MEMKKIHDDRKMNEMAILEQKKADEDVLKLAKIHEVIQFLSEAFIVNDDEMDDARGASDEELPDEEDDLFGSICAICDDGGDLLCCDGICMRSFHATKEAGAGSNSECRSLGFINARQVKDIQSFICKNCQYNQHQCFVCFKLGSSDKASGAEVFRCVNATCGLFYHPHCVSKIIHRDDESAAEEIREKIAAGEPFTCPIHRCYVCKKLEDKNDPELQFAVCRRCPKSYHRKCLPRKIAFEDIEEEGIIKRAWEDLMPKRILIYCLKHEIDEGLGTPRGDQVKFPVIKEKENKQLSDSPSKSEKFNLKKRSLDLAGISHEKAAKKPRMSDSPQVASENPVTAKPVRAAAEKLEKGCSIEDAIAVCEPEILHPIIRWKNKLLSCSSFTWHALQVLWQAFHKSE